MTPLPMPKAVAERLSIIHEYHPDIIEATSYGWLDKNFGAPLFKDNELVSRLNQLGSSGISPPYLYNIDYPTVFDCYGMQACILARDFAASHIYYFTYKDFTSQDFPTIPEAIQALQVYLRENDFNYFLNEAIATA